MCPAAFLVTVRTHTRVFSLSHIHTHTHSLSLSLSVPLSLPLSLCKQRKIDQLMLKYDATGNGKLSRSELAPFLRDLADGAAPTDEECRFVLVMADRADGNVDGLLDKSELETAAKIWKGYLESKEDIEATFAKFDQNQSGKLEFEQLKALLTELNEGMAPADEEVQMVMEEADGIAGQSTGGINVTELKVAISVWYNYVQEKEASACCRVT